MTALDPHTQELLDEYACRRALERYWYWMNERDIDHVVESFTEDGRWGAAVGRDAQLAQGKAFFDAMGVIDRMATAPGSILIEVDGDTATGFVQGIATLVRRRSDGSQAVTVTDALYYLEFRRERDGWRISSMRGKKNPEAPHDDSFQFNADMAVIDHGMNPDA